ncbi:MAG: tRNA pseudouridine(55) synthase TruB [Candidatus Eisenbacteria bacterium]
MRDRGSGRQGKPKVGESGAGTGFVLNIYKEISWSSHHAVDRVRRILGLRKVGHAGTLDPLASGVLLIGVGRATKLLSYLTDLPKVYRGTLRFGMRTASADLGGAILEEVAPPVFEQDAIESAARAFVGGYDQLPPMVSAVKHEGKRLYHLARKGVEIERKPRRVEIHRFDVLDYSHPRVDFEVECSKGTYVRALAEDLAASLGTIATIECLTRTAVGTHSIDDSQRLISRPGSTRDGLRAGAVAMADAVGHLPAVGLSAAQADGVRRGLLPARSDIHGFFESTVGTGSVRLLGPDGHLLAMAKLGELPGPADSPVDGLLSLDRVF